MPRISSTTRWSRTPSFFSSSRARSSASRATSRRLRSNCSCFSRRTSGVMSGPFFSSSSPSFLISSALPSNSFCIAARSRSSASRAWAPAADRASTRLTSTNAIRDTGSPPACAGGCGCAWAPAGAARSISAAPARIATTVEATIPHRICLIVFSSERRADRELDGARIFTLPGIQLESVVEPERAERRVPAYAGPGRPQEPVAELRAEAECVAGVEEHRHPEIERQGDDVLEVAEDLGRAADAQSRAIQRRDLAELPAPDRVGTAQVEALEHRQVLGTEADAVADFAAARQNVPEPQLVEVVLRHDRLQLSIVAAEARDVQRERREPALGRGRHVVAIVSRQRERHERRDRGADLVAQQRLRRSVDVTDLVLRQPVGDEPAPVFPERVADARPTPERLVVVLGELLELFVDVGAGRQRRIEEPRVREAQGALLGRGAGPDPERHLPAPPQEVVLDEVDRADERVHRRVAATDREEPGGPLGHVDVDDDLALVRAGVRRHVHPVEVVQVHQPLAGALELLQGEEVALDHRNLATQDLVLTPRVARDVDALDVDLRTLRDLVDDVDLQGRGLVGARIHLRGRPPDRAVHRGDAVDARPEIGAGKDGAGLGTELAPELDLREQRDARERDLAHLVLGALDHRDADRDPGARPVHGEVVRLDPRLDVSEVVVERDDALDIDVETLALDRTPEHEELPFLRLQRVLDLRLGEVEDDLDVPVGEFLHRGRDLNLEIPVVLVGVPDLLDGALDVHRAVDTAQLEVDLFEEVRRGHLRVAGELDVAQEGPLDDHERHLHAALEVLDLELYVVEEAEAEDRADVLAQL